MGLSTCGTIVGSSGQSPELLCDNGTGTGKVSVENEREWKRHGRKVLNRPEWTVHSSIS